jgi:hypothetical protein
MNTQLTPQAVTDEQLAAVDGGGVGSSLLWALGNIPTLGIPLIVDSATGSHVTRDAAANKF